MFINNIAYTWFKWLSHYRQSQLLWKHLRSWLSCYCLSRQPAIRYVPLPKYSILVIHNEIFWWGLLVIGSVSQSTIFRTLQLLLNFGDIFATATLPLLQTVVHRSITCYWLIRSQLCSSLTTCKYQCELWRLHLRVFKRSTFQNQMVMRF